jgi:hypothetical protein
MLIERETSTMARTIANTISGPLVLSLSDPLASGGSDDPLTITSTGTINSTGDGIDGDASVPWTVTNHGTVSAQANGIVLEGDGRVANSGEIILSMSGGSGSAVAIGGDGTFFNSGTIIAQSHYGVSDALTMGSGSVVNSGEMVSLLGDAISLGTGTVRNSGDIIGAVNLGSGVMTNTGTVMGFGGIAIGGISLGFGTLFNSGLIQSYMVGVTLGDGSRFFNRAGGSVEGRSSSLHGGNEVTVVNQGELLGGEFGGPQLGDNSSIANSGTILGEVQMGVGGTVTNSGFIQGEYLGVSLASGRLTNQGTILGGVVIANGGTVINTGSINDAIEIQTGSGTVINDGILFETIANPPPDSVEFDAGTTNNLLEIGPGATIAGDAEATYGSNSTVELTKGTGAISGIGTGQFDGFDNLSVNSGAAWTLNGANTIASVLDDGTVAVAGSLDVSSAVNPASTGLFDLLGGSTLDVAAALGSRSQMSFAAPSELVVDNAALFGTHVGTNGYAGPLLEDFVSGATIDLRAFSPVGLSESYSSAKGLLQLRDGASQVATLHFQNSSLGGGTFAFNSDGAGGLLITHS